MMIHHKVATQEEAVARTMVIWDIKSCHVPSGCDARRVGPWIKRTLENVGYSGPLTITAIGHLIDFPEDVLKSVSSTGISLYHISLDVVNILDAMIKWGDDDPANILLISARDFFDGLEYLQRKEFNILSQILYDDSHKEAFPTSTNMNYNSYFMPTDTMDSQEKSSESDWLCMVCEDDDGNYLAGKGFSDLQTHLWSQEHRVQILEFLPCDYKLRRDDDEMRKAPTREEAEARTWVMWDIKSCPVPSGCDARRIGPCIKRTLENLGYSGPLTIIAIGHLIDFPKEVLQSVSSTGISLYTSPMIK